MVFLKETKDINFIGNTEARDISLGDADVVVCDAFVGNVFKGYGGLWQEYSPYYQERNFWLQLCLN